MAASAYLSVFDDWTLLPPVLAQIAPRVDEIVVVDGAYRWMAPALASMGRDPARSDPRLRAALAPFAAKTRWVEGLWENEQAKRMAGYAACSHRWAWRIDADEVLFIDDAALDRFWASGRAVAEMDMPLHAAPGLVLRRADGSPQRQALLFDRDRLQPRSHLAYLWLVQPPEERASMPAPEPGCVFAEPVAFNAHLTHWRPPGGALTRARFYVMNWLREGHETHWAPGFRYGPEAGFAPFLDAVPPAALADLLRGHRLVAGLPEGEGLAACASPLGPAQEAQFAPLFGALLAGLAQLNAALAARPRVLAWGEPHWLDLSTPAATAPLLGAPGTLALRYAAAPGEVRAVLHRLHPGEPWRSAEPLAVACDGPCVTVALPQEDGAIRRSLELTAWGGGRLTTLRAG